MRDLGLEPGQQAGNDLTGRGRGGRHDAGEMDEAMGQIIELHDLYRHRRGSTASTAIRAGGSMARLQAANGEARGSAGSAPAR